MATAPQPPRPPAAPQPPGTRGNLLAIVLLALGLIVVAGVAGVLVGLHFLVNAVHVNVEQAAGKKAVSIKTPVGSLEVNRGINEASLNLPIYPGATPIPERDSATVNIDIADQTNVRVLAGRFETSDPLQKVVTFYHDRLGDDVTRYKDKDDQGKTVFEIKHDEQDRIVTLKNNGIGTVIELVRVSKGPAEAN